MLPNQTMYDENNVQVALFPLEGFIISQAWYDNYSHDESRYYATDFVAIDANGNRVLRAPCYAPCNIQLLWVDRAECCALWQSTIPVHFADGSIDFLGIIVYHDNDIEDGNYSSIGDIKSQGEIFNRTGTGGNVTGDHVHLETGKGEVLLSNYKYHFLDNTRCRRIKPDEALFVNNTYVTPKERYNWKIYEGGTPADFFKKTKFPWHLFARKLRNKRKR